MIEITVSKKYLFYIGILTFGFIYTSLSLGTAFWISQVFQIFLMMYLIHEPAHVLMAMAKGVKVTEVNLGNQSGITFVGVSEENPDANEIETQIYGGGFAVDFAGFLIIITTCLLWGMAHGDFISIAFGIVIAVVFLIGCTVPGSDWQEIQSRLTEKAGA